MKIGYTFYRDTIPAPEKVPVAVVPNEFLFECLKRFPDIYTCPDQVVTIGVPVTVPFVLALPVRSTCPAIVPEYVR